MLAIDTASDEIAVAFAPGEGPVRVLCRDGERNHSQLLLGMIDEVTASDRHGIGSIVVVRGPGSYAGLRVGVATARGLALGLGVPIAGTGTLEAAAAAAGQPGKVWGLHPTGRGEFALQEFIDGVPTSALTAAGRGDLPAGPLIGEGADAFGGIAVGPRERCLAALAIAEERRAGPPEALYLREPYISVARRRAAISAG